MSMRSRSVSASLGALLCLAVLASIVVFAVVADGREGTESTTNDGGAWLVNQRVGSIGHVNRTVAELSAAVRVSQPGATFEVHQPNGAVVAHDVTGSSLQVIDERTQLVVNGIKLPDGARVHEYATGVVVTAENPFRLWRIDRSELAALRSLDGLDPMREAGGAPAWAVSRSGVVAIDDIEAGVLVLVAPDGTVSTLDRSAPVSQIMFDGDRPVARVGGRIGVVRDGSLDLVGDGAVAWDGVHRSMPETAGSVVAATSAGELVRIDSSDGAMTRIGTLPGADPSDVIELNDCVHVVVNDPPTFWARCGEGEPLITALQTSGTTRLRLRLVNGWIWINDLLSGNLWMVDDELELNRIDDWGAVLPQDIDPEDLEITAVESPDDIVEEIENPDADDARIIADDQFDEDGINQPPVAYPDEDTETHQARPVVVDVTANDEDEDNDVLLVSSVENLSGSAAVVRATIDGRGVQVTPAPGFEGVVAFTYTITDGRGGSDSARGSVVVRARTGDDNRAPIATTDIGSVTGGERLILNVLANDTDPDGDSLVLTAASAEQGGVTFDPSGQVVYQPETVAEEGEITISYVVADDFGATAEGRVRVSVRLPDSNQPPDARNDGGITIVGQPITLNLLANDTDPDGDELFVAQRPELFAPADLDVFTTITPDGEFVFIPDRSGTFLFSYGASDDEATDLAQIRIEVNEAIGNTPPIAVRDDIVIPAGESRIVYVLENDGDPDGDLVGIVDFLVGPGSGLRVEEFGDVGFRVFADEEGPNRRTFQYSISDGASDPVGTTVVVAVADAPGINQPPVAQPDAAEVRPGASVSVPVLANDFDPEGGPLRVVGLTDPTGALATIGPAAQSVRVSVDALTTTSFSLTYDVVDDQDNRTAAVIRVRVIPDGEPNRPPIARPDPARAEFETQLAVPVIVNDSDPDGDAIRVESVTAQPTNGVAEIDPVTGDVLYTPAEGFSGRDRLSYAIVDALGARAEGEVLIVVLPEPRPNRDPIAVDDSYITVATGESIDLDVLLNDRDPDGDQLRIVTFVPPEIGQVERTIDQRLLVFRAPIEQADDRTVVFDYEITDGAGGRAEASITVLVQATPPRPEGAPIAVDDEVGPVPTGSEVRVDVVLNDSDPDAPVSELVVDVFDAGARVEGQTVVFAAPEADTEISYRITDADGKQDAAIISVSVVNLRPPVAIDDQFGPVKQGEIVDLEVLANDYDIDGEPTDLEIVSVTGDGARVGDGVVRVEAPAESTQYTYTIADADGLEASATISLIVIENRAPIVAPQQVSTPFGESIEIDLSASAVDPDGDPLFFSCCQTTRSGAPQVLDAGEGLLIVEFTPDEDFSGDAFFSFEVDDQFGHVVAGSVTVSVEAQPNRPPTVVDDVVTLQAPRADAPAVVTEVDLGALADDPDDDPLAFAIDSGPGNGLSAAVAGSTLEITATDAASPGTTTLTWVVADPDGETAVGALEVTITEPQNDPPEARDTTVTVPAGNSTTTDLAALVFDDDSDEILTYEIVPVGDPLITITQTGDADVTVAAAVNAAERSTSFDYTVTDRMGETGTARVTIEVGEPDAPPPVAEPDQATTLQEQAVEINVLANDSDPLGQGLTIVDPGSSDNGTVEALGAAVRFTPGAAFFGTTSFAYTIGDAAELASRQSTATVTIEVIGRPSAPTAPTCTPDSTLVNLTWTEPDNNGATIEGYSLEYTPDGSATISSQTSYTWGDLTNGREYRFRLAARNAAGLGDFSDWSLPCTPDIEPERPAPPQVSHGDGYLQVSWTEPVNNGSPIEQYEVRLGGGTTVVVESGTTYRWEGLVNGQDYTFQVAARNAKGLSPFSTPSTPEHPSTVPGSPVIGATTRAGLIGSDASGILQVNWTAVPTASDGGDTISHYLVERRQGGVRQVDGANANRYIWSGLPNGVQYEFRVTAVNRDGQGAPSAWSPPMQACTIPSPPTGASATEGDTRAFVDFGAPVDDGGCAITGYRVREAGTSGSGVTVSHPPSQVTMSGLVNGNVYAFEVQARNTLGSSSWVQTNSVVPKGAPICPNAYRVVSIDPTGTTLAWDAANFNGGTSNEYQRQGNSGTWHSLGNTTAETVPAWSEGTHTLRLRAVNEVGTDDCGEVTFTTCPSTPPAPPTPDITAIQSTQSVRIFNLRDPNIACLSQPEVTGNYQIAELEVVTEVWNPFEPSYIQYRQAGQEITLGPNLIPGQEFTTRVRACYPGRVCGTWSPVTPTVQIDLVGTLTIWRSTPDLIDGSGPGGPVHCWDEFSIAASGGDPNQGCYFVRIETRNFPPGSYTVRCFSTMNDGFWRLYDTVTVNGNDDRDACSYSLAGRSVVAVLDGTIAGQPNGSVNVSSPAVASNIITDWPVN